VNESKTMVQYLFALLFWEMCLKKWKSADLHDGIGVIKTEGIKVSCCENF